MNETTDKIVIKVKKLYESPEKIHRKIDYYREGLAAASIAMANVDIEGQHGVHFHNGKMVVYDNEYGSEGMGICMIDYETKAEDVIHDLESQYVRWLEWRLEVQRR